MNPQPDQSNSYYYLQVNQYSGGATGHVNLTFLDHGQNVGTFGLNVDGPPNNSNPLASGVHEESTTLSNAQASHTVHSITVMVDASGFTNALNHARADTNDTAEGHGHEYWIDGDNCVDYVHDRLVDAGIKGVDSDPVAYMQNDGSLVYKYAALQNVYDSFFLNKLHEVGGAIDGKIYGC